MCQPGGSRRSFGTQGYDCGCGCCTFNRRFISAKEEQERLENYSEQLKNELGGVEERIQELKSK